MLRKDDKRNTIKWTFPTENSFQKSEEPLKKEKPIVISPRAIIKIISPVVGAIIVGIIFGIFVLSFAENQLYNETSLPANTSPETLIESDIIVPVVQVGVFSTLEAAKETANKLPKDLPKEVVKQDDQYYVLVSIEPTIEQAKESEEIASSKGIDAYARDFKVTSNIVGALNSEEQKELSKIVNNFYQMLSVKGSNDAEEIKSVQLEKVNAAEGNPEFSKIVDAYENLEKSFEIYQETQLPEQTKSLTDQMLNFLAIFGGF